MAKKKKLYVVMMVRFSKSHSYILGVFDTKTKATKIGEIEKEWRGNTKYYPHILELDKNVLSDDTGKIIVDAYDSIKKDYPQ